MKLKNTLKSKGERKKRRRRWKREYGLSPNVIEPLCRFCGAQMLPAHTKYLSAELRFAHKANPLGDGNC